jgi:hypothetical protein
MTNLAVIKATFSDWRTVKGRKQLQLIFEVPLEQQSDVLARLGAPNSENPLWCAIAMLTKEATEPKPVDVSKSERGKEQYRQKDAMEQAAIRACILCEDLKFKLWASKRAVPGITDTASWLRFTLNIHSRNEISNDQRAYDAFLALETQYKMDVGLLAEAR